MHIRENFFKTNTLFCFSCAIFYFILRDWCKNLTQQVQPKATWTILNEERKMKQWIFAFINFGFEELNMQKMNDKNFANLSNQFVSNLNILLQENCSKLWNKNYFHKPFICFILLFICKKINLKIFLFKSSLFFCFFLSFFFAICHDFLSSKKFQNTLKFDITLLHLN